MGCSQDQDEPYNTIIPIHYQLLYGVGSNQLEKRGKISSPIISMNPSEENTIEVVSTNGFFPPQLLFYQKHEFKWSSTVLKSITGNRLSLTNPIDENISTWDTIYAFYVDRMHPIHEGYIALADFALEITGTGSINYGTHVLLGDSWFKDGTIARRLSNRLSNARIINSGIGGNKANQMLERFERDVAIYNPEYVWLLTGTNDYVAMIDARTYADRIVELVEKINDIGANAIVFEPSVGVQGTALEFLSHEYVEALKGTEFYINAYPTAPAR
ncbi:MAG: SGNH/GDSL hydrolase family protein [Candidatus Electryonea clarkiae]|nr:SGNH/GDSL hydrolase family protein [Candidatus Electryonea clarkiae]MDP8288337.1 SGNH/GDSL hydrolase family protein [Candidatus Electryonea clarkiae]